jgi:hypothetical protein
MNKKEIFELIKDSSPSYGEARRIASQWAELPEEKQDFHISGRLTLHLALETSRLDSAGKYREAARLMCQVPGIGMKSALRTIKRTRIEARHNRPVWVGSCGGPNKEENYSWPHCKCGWHGKKIYGEGSSDKARKKVCPKLKKELTKYGLRYYKDKPLFGRR